MNNPFNINETRIFIYEGLNASVKCEHELSGISIEIKRPRERASLLDMRAEALNEIKYLVTNSPRYARILKDAQNQQNDAN